MTDDLIEFIGTRLPLRIDHVEVADPIVTFIGDRWWLALACPWQLLEAQDVRTAWDRADVEDAVWDLVGCEVVTVRRAGNLIDPIFTLSGDMDLVVDADSDLDPWVLRVDERTFVGTSAQPLGEELMTYDVDPAGATTEL